MAGGPVEAHGRGTVIDILTTALTGPAIDAHTAVATQCVRAGAPVVARIGLQLTLIHVLCAELACATQMHQPSHLDWCIPTQRLPPSSLQPQCPPVHSGGHWQL